MKTIMKKINVLAIAAMIVGGGFAYATQKNILEPNIYLDPNSNEWLPLGEMVKGDDYDCVASLADCTAHTLDPENPEPQLEIISKGSFEFIR